MERIRVLCEDMFKPASRWNMNQVLLIIATIVEGLNNKLAMMVSTYVDRVQFFINTFQDTIFQNALRTPTSQNVQMNNINIKCFKYKGPHYKRVCIVKRCSKCGKGHYKAACKVPAAQLLFPTSIKGMHIMVQ